MPFVPITNATQVNVKGLLVGQQYENVWGVQTADPPTLTDLQDIAATFQTSYAGILVPLSIQLAITEIEVRYLGSEAGPIYQLFINPAQVGGDESISLPNNVAFCVKLSSALPGRQFRGRKYFGGLPVAQVTENQINSDFADVIVGAVSGLIEELGTNGTPLSIVSKTHGTIVPVVAAGYVDLVVDSQRRRLPGRGR